MPMIITQFIIFIPIESASFLQMFQQRNYNWKKFVRHFLHNFLEIMYDIVAMDTDNMSSIEYDLFYQRFSYEINLIPNQNGSI